MKFLLKLIRFFIKTRFLTKIASLKTKKMSHHQVKNKYKIKNIENKWTYQIGGYFKKLIDLFEDVEDN